MEKIKVERLICDKYILEEEFQVVDKLPEPHEFYKNGIVTWCVDISNRIIDKYNGAYKYYAMRVWEGGATVPSEEYPEETEYLDYAEYEDLALRVK